MCDREVPSSFVKYLVEELHSRIQGGYLLPRTHDFPGERDPQGDYLVSIEPAKDEVLTLLV